MTTKRLVGVIAFAAIAACLIAWQHARTQRNFLASVEQALPYSAAIGAGTLHDWLNLRETQAFALATMAANVSGSGDATETIVRPALVAMEKQRAFVKARFVRVNEAPPAHLSTGTIQDSLTIVNFVAPITQHDSIAGWIELSSVINEAAFTEFNAAAADDHTHRTTLLEVQRDSMRVLTSSSAGGGTRPAQSRASIPLGIRIDSSLQRDVLQHASVVSHGIGIGLYGKRVVYARAPVTGAPWLLVRERDVDELTTLIAPSLRFSDGVWALLVILMIGITMQVWRSTSLRRERDAIQLRSAFVQSVSHELRTPLTQIRMYAEMLQLSLLPSPKDAKRALTVIEKEAGRLTLMVERSLTFLRTGVDSREQTVGSCLIADVVREAIVAIAPLATEAQVRITMDVCDDVRVQIDRDALHQILLNLLDNAIKHGPNGQHVEVHGLLQGSVLQLSVNDQGPGIPSIERQSVFKAFVRGKDAETKGVPGSGIGLAVVHDIVARAGGRVWIGSNVAHVTGAQFAVELPVVSKV